MTDQFLNLWPLIQRRAKAIYRRCDLIDADDLAQAAAMRVWKELPAYDPQQASLTTWAYTRINSAMLDLIRSQGSPLGRSTLRGTVHFGQLEDVHPAPEQQNWEGVHDRLRGLTQRERLICLLLADGLTRADIARSIGFDAAIVTRTLKDVCEKLRPASVFSF